MAITHITETHRFLGFLAILISIQISLPFSILPVHKYYNHVNRTPRTTLSATKSSSKKKSGSSSNASSTTGIKGFGSLTTSASKTTKDIPIDRSPAAMKFYSFLENNGAGTNLKRVALGFFPVDPNNKESPKIRGVVALQKIDKGDIIIEIPYEAAFNLGQESNDPTLPATMVLQEYCKWISSDATSQSLGAERRSRDLGPYLSVFPEFRSIDVLGSTDFFSDEALEALQYPPIVDETKKRKERIKERFERDILPMTQISSNLYGWENGQAITEEHLRWAVWLVTSRVLTVQGEEGTGEKFRLMIPLIDMCNHDRNSVHVLSGRAVIGGTLKVIAGKAVLPGEQIFILYNNGVSGNDRFIQDYGFLDTSANGMGYDIVAKILTGKTRIVDGAGALGGRPTLMPLDERDRIFRSLKLTTLEQDTIAAQSYTSSANDIKSAFEYRIGVKQALRRLDPSLGF